MLLVVCLDGGGGVIASLLSRISSILTNNGLGSAVAGRRKLIQVVGWACTSSRARGGVAVKRNFLGAITRRCLPELRSCAQCLPGTAQLACLVRRSLSWPHRGAAGALHSAGGWGSLRAAQPSNFLPHPPSPNLLLRSEQIEIQTARGTEEGDQACCLLLLR